MILNLLGAVHRYFDFFEIQRSQTVIVEDDDNIGYFLETRPVMSGVVSGAGMGSMLPFKREAPNGEGMIDVHANRRALFDVAPLEFWKDCERNARRARF